MLQVRYKNSDKRPLWLVDKAYSIGSAVDCDIPVQDGGVAARQATLEVSVTGVVIDNLGAVGDILVNGEALAQRAPLKHGDEVLVGKIALELVDPKLNRNTQSVAKPSEDVTHDWSLKALNTALANKEFPIEREVTLGRSNECDITLGVAHLSRRHATLRLIEGNLEVEDLRSSNGTYVNRKKVHRCLLKHGDELSFDTLSFKVNGPPDVGESTVVRTSLEPPNVEEKTTVRSAIKVPGTQHAGLKPKPQENNQSRRRSSTGARTQTSFTYREEVKSEGNSRMYVILLVLFVALAAAWYLLI